MRSYTDADLLDAVAVSYSWRGVLRALGLAGTSSGAARSVRRRADLLGLDYTHFRGQRRWSDAQLREAVRRSSSWSQVAIALGLAGGSSTTTLRGHAVRLGLDAEHLGPQPLRRLTDLRPDPDLLPRAGTLLAAAWFELAGCPTSWPLEPVPYDLLVAQRGGFRRVQVKTTRHRVGRSWRVRLISGSRASGTYDPDEVDDLFAVTAAREHYLIPFSRVAGLSEITLSAYSDYLLPT